MKIIVKDSYNFELLNMLNILTGDRFYTDIHEEVYEEFKDKVSDESQGKIAEAVELNGTGMLSPALIYIISAVEEFEEKPVSDLIRDIGDLRDLFEEDSVYSEDIIDRYDSILKLVLPVIEELEEINFRRYWEREKKPLIDEKKIELQNYLSNFDMTGEIEKLIGEHRLPDTLELYVCSLLAPHGVRLYGPRYASDTSFTKEITLSTAIHELFHPPYDRKELVKVYDKLSRDPLVVEAFETKNPKYGYPEMEGFIEENIVEAMALHVCSKLGLQDDPYSYLKRHDEGSHVLSFVLLDYFDRYPKEPDQDFQEYFEELVEKMPVGGLNGEYFRVMSEWTRKMEQVDSSGGISPHF